MDQPGTSTMEDVEVEAVDEAGRVSSTCSRTPSELRKLWPLISADRAALGVAAMEGAQRAAASAQASRPAANVNVLSNLSSKVPSGRSLRAVIARRPPGSYFRTEAEEPRA